MFLLNKWSETVEPSIFISSKRVREYFLHHIQSLQIHNFAISHGPCLSTNNHSFDCAQCFQCKEWIKPVKKWINRSSHTWPDSVLTQSIVKYGVLFVPIGCKDSVTQDLEWRISFSVAEKLLVYSFSHTQLLCYALLKIVLKDIIQHKHDDLLCSYFLKMIIFWLCEESAVHQWKPEMFV